MGNNLFCPLGILKFFDSFNLQALLKKKEYGGLEADYDSNCIRWCPSGPDNGSFEANFDKATVFTVKGSLYSFVRISCKTPTGETLYWTWSKPKSTSQSVTDITLEHYNEESNFQRFKFVCKYGNDLVSFIPYTEGERSLHVRATSELLQVHFGYLGEKIIIPNVYAAPLHQTFLMLPKNKSAKFYHSLNFMFNSVRFDKESQRIRHDEIFTDLTESAKKEASVSDILTSEYCFILLIRKSILKIVANLKESALLEKGSPSYRNAVSSYIEEIKQCHKNMETFDEELDPNGQYNSFQKPISQEAFRAYLTHLSNYHVSDEDSPPEEQILSHILRSHGVRNLISDYESIEPRFSILVSNCQEIEQKIWDPFGASAEIIQKCFEKYEPDNPNDNGHMAIIRVKESDRKRGKPTLNGNKLKQSLCIAKKIGGIDNLEIIQDYGDSATMTTTCLGQHVKTAGDNAKKFRHPESLRIMKKIQTTDCEALIQMDDGRESKKDNRQPCLCSSYEPEAVDTLICKNCSHIHKEFKSYSDLKGLPCLLILINNGRMGDTFPPSFIAMDDRSSYLTRPDFRKNGNLAAFAQEKGRLCRYTTLSEKLPTVYVGKGMFETIESSIQNDCCYHHIVAETKKFAHNVTFNSTTFQLEPKKKHADYKNESLPRNNHFIFSCEPQIGKTNSFLQLIASVRKIVERPKEEIEPDHDVHDSESETEEESAAVVPTHREVTKFQAIVPYHLDLDQQKYPLKIGPSKWDRFVDEHPMTKAPNIPIRTRRASGKKSKKNISGRELVAHRYNHPICQSCWYNDGIFTKYITFNEEWLCEALKVTCPDLEWYRDFFDKGSRQMMIILTPSFHGAESARLNYDHLMKNEAGEKVPYLHFVFVQKNQFEQYSKFWENKVALVEVPNKMRDILEDVHQGGIGYFRRFMMHFATHQGIDDVCMCDDSLVFFKQATFDDKGLIRRDENGRLEMEDASLYNILKQLERIGSQTEDVPLTHRGYTKHPECPQNSDKIETFSGPKSNYVLYGARKNRPVQAQRNLLRKTHITSFMVINNKALMSLPKEKKLSFPPWRAREDLQFCYDANAAGLNVLKLSCFEFVKTNSRDPLDLYIWDKEEGVLEKEREGLQQKIIPVLKKFVKGLKIGSLFTENYTLYDKVKQEARTSDKYKDKVDLLLLNTFVTPTLMPGTNEIVIIFPYDGECKKHASYQYFWNQLNDILPSKELDYLVVGSTHRPCVPNDYIVLRMRFKDKSPMKTESELRNRSISTSMDRQEIGIGAIRPPVSDDEPPRKITRTKTSDEPQKQVTFESLENPFLTEELPTYDQRVSETPALEEGVPSTSQGVTRNPLGSKPPKRRKILQKKPQRLKLKESNEDIPLEASAESESRPDDIKQMRAKSADIYYEDFYTLNNIRARQRKDKEYPAVIVKVVSKPLKSRNCSKHFVHVEDIGEKFNHQSCMIHWYQESKPPNVHILEPNGHYRFENVFAERDQKEEHNKFQLKLTDKSKIIPILDQRHKNIRFHAQSILNVKKGYNDYMDFNGQLLKVEPIKRGFIRLHFKCMQTNGSEPCMFELKSEPIDDLDTDQIMEKYLGRFLKIRAAKIIYRPDEKRSDTVIYKNFDGIRYFNDEDEDEAQKAAKSPKKAPIKRGKNIKKEETCGEGDDELGPPKCKADKKDELETGRM